ncbi:hypothetical protein FQR65_LT10915 [Abscondita terminalis]|nr:hypothetical protein FQR65_LT10915 [Abscondita terminalis]
MEVANSSEILNGNSEQSELKEIEENLLLAKLNPDSLESVTQIISFTSQELHNNNYKLLQLDEGLINQFAKDGTVHIKGDDNENAVLCTETATFDVLETETSNSLLLVEQLKFKNSIKDSENKKTISNVTIHSIFYDYLELVASKPRLQKLHELLDKSIYKGPEHENEIDDSDLFTYNDILDRIQASKKELDNVLSGMHILTMNDKIRKLDFEYHFRILSYMLKLIEENSWALDEIDYEETLESLSQFIPREVVACLFEIYAEDSKIIDGIQLYRYKETDVCRFFARVLLYNAGKFNFQEFLQAWQESVPEGMTTDLEMLQGISIINQTSIPNVIYAFEEEKLPENVNERFEVLFHAKEKWTVPEITPYIQKMTTDKADVNAILAKHARASTVDGVKYYSSKHKK